MITAKDLKKISKRKAKQFYEAGRSIYVLPVSKNPEDTIFGLNTIRLYKNKYPISDFDTIIQILYKQSVGKTFWNRLHYYVSEVDFNE